MKPTGVPSPRPRCAMCDKPMPYFTDHERATVGPYPRPVVRATFKFWKGYPQGQSPVFDTLRCALDFAVAAHQAGYRIARKEGA